MYGNQPVWDDISGPLLNTLPMIIAGTVISIVLGVASGVISAWRRGTAADAGSLWTSLVCYAMPTQWIGLLVVFYVATAVGLPRAGKWREVLNTDAIAYGGSNTGNLGGLIVEMISCHNQPGSAEMTLPPLGVVAFQPEPSEPEPDEEI